MSQNQRLTVPLEIKNLQSREFDGYGSVFKNVDLGDDIVVPGAFAKSLEDHEKNGTLPQMFWMHDPSRVPGKWLSMSEDKRGLAVKGVLADTELGNEIHTLLKMEAVRGLSIGYKTIDDDFTENGIRLIKEAELWEVSVVSLPMNPLAQVAHIKSRLSAEGAYVPTPREFENEFRRMGCSKQVSRKLISMIFDDSAGATLADEDEKAGATLAKDEPSRCDADGEKEAADAMRRWREEYEAARFRKEIEALRQ